MTSHPSGIRLQQKRFQQEECETNEDLHDFYGGKCRSGVPQTSPYGPGLKAKYTAFMPVSGSNGVFETYFDLGTRLASPRGALEDIAYVLKP